MLVRVSIKYYYRRALSGRRSHLITGLGTHLYIWIEGWATQMQSALNNFPCSIRNLERVITACYSTSSMLGPTWETAQTSTKLPTQSWWMKAYQAIHSQSIGCLRPWVSMPLWGSLEQSHLVAELMFLNNIISN